MILLTTKQMAVRYGVHSKTFLKWVRDLPLPVIRINCRCIRFDPIACDAIINKRTYYAAA